MCSVRPPWCLCSRGPLAPQMPGIFSTEPVASLPETEITAFTEGDVAPPVLHDKAPQTIHQPRFVEVQQQANPQTAHTQVSAKLRFMRQDNGGH